MRPSPTRGAWRSTTCPHRNRLKSARREVQLRDLPRRGRGSVGKHFAARGGIEAPVRMAPGKTNFKLGDSTRRLVTHPVLAIRELVCLALEQAAAVVLDLLALAAVAPGLVGAAREQPEAFQSRPAIAHHRQGAVSQALPADGLAK